MLLSSYTYFFNRTADSRISNPIATYYIRLRRRTFCSLLQSRLSSETERVYDVHASLRKDERLKCEVGCWNGARIDRDDQVIILTGKALDTKTSVTLEY